MQTACATAAYMAQDNFGWREQLAQTPEVTYSESDNIGANNGAPVRQYIKKTRPISVVLRGFFRGATVAHPWRTILRECARMVSFM